MESTFENKNDRVYSKVVRAGKRTYFFDVKSTRGGDYYLTITESKRKLKDDGTDGHFFLKTKLFLYKEDFEKFNSALKEVTDYIRKEKGIPDNAPVEQNEKTGEQDYPSNTPGQFTNINFEDLGSRKQP